MIKSMTAYGRGECRQGDTLFVAEIRSLNNRHRDIVMRLPKRFQALEKDIRSLVFSRVRRGRLDVSIQTENGGEEVPYSLDLNVPLVSSYLRIFKQLAEEFGLDQEIRIESLCQMKDVILFRPEDADLEEARSALLEALNQALDSLDIMRDREGKAIESDFLKRLDLLEKYTDEISGRVPELVEDYRNHLNDKMQNILKDVAVDENRLIQEVAFFAERSDITEELVRIRSHLEQFHKYLSLDDALGRRLDFLIQESNREVNTLSTKASDAFISKIVVEMKAELEKLREQVQNVE